MMRYEFARDLVGDECFHDVLDFMYALQTWSHCAPVLRADFLGTAQRVVSQGELMVVPLHEFLLSEAYSEKLFELLLIMDLPGCPVEGAEDDVLPEDLMARRDKVVSAFFIKDDIEGGH